MPHLRARRDQQFHHRHIPSRGRQFERGHARWIFRVGVRMALQQKFPCWSDRPAKRHNRAASSLLQHAARSGLLRGRAGAEQYLRVRPTLHRAALLRPACPACPDLRRNRATSGPAGSSRCESRSKDPAAPALPPGIARYKPAGDRPAGRNSEPALASRHTVTGSSANPTYCTSSSSGMPHFRSTRRFSS